MKLPQTTENRNPLSTTVFRKKKQKNDSANAYFELHNFIDSIVAAQEQTRAI